MTLNDIAENIFTINLIRRKDRFDHFMEQTNKFDFHAMVTAAVDSKEIVNPTNLRPGEYALLLSYAKIIEWAKLRAWDKIIILEDDVVFEDDLNDRLEREWKLIPDNWDLVYLGENNCSLGAGWLPSTPVNESIRRIYSSFGAHAIVIKSHMYNRILDGIMKFDKPLDVMYCDLQSSSHTYGFNRPLAKQKSFESDIIGFNPMYLEQGVFDK